MRFTGKGFGAGELSWGQLYIWRKMMRVGHSMAMGGLRELPPDTTIDQVAANLAYLVGRYQSMRTLVEPRVGMRPCQRVYSSGEITLEVVDAGSEDPALVAEVLCQRYRKVPFDHTVEWPVRMAAVQSGGKCWYAVVIVSHLALDGTGALLMMAETASRSSEPEGGMPPLEQARWQASDAGQKQNAAALRFWQRQLAQIPNSSHSQAAPRTPRHWNEVFRSPLMPAALAAIGAAAGADEAPVLLAVFVTAFAAVMGQGTVAVRPVVSNRFRPGLAATVSPVSQPGQCVVEVGGLPFAQVLQRASSQLPAYKYAYGDPDDIDGVIAEAAVRFGPHVNADVNFNDRRRAGLPQSPSFPVDTSGDSGGSRFAWVDFWDTPSSAFFVNADQNGDLLQLTIAISWHRRPAKLCCGRWNPSHAKRQRTYRGSSCQATHPTPRSSPDRRDEPAPPAPNSRSVPGAVRGHVETAVRRPCATTAGWFRCCRCTA